MVGAVGVGILLDRLFNQIDQTIDNAKNAGKQLEIEAGIQVRRAIENAKVAYADSLNLTMDRVDKAAQDALGKLQTLVNDAIAGQADLLQTLASRAQQVANTLPCHNDRPQLTGVSPRFTLDQDPVRFKFMGNFEHAGNSKCTPQLEFNGKKFSPNHSETQRLEFEVPRATLFPGINLTTIQKIIHSQGVLEAFWPTTLAGINIAGINKATFKIMISAIPPSPGSITLEYKTFKVITEERPYQSDNFHLDSCKEGNRKENYLWWGGDNKTHENFEFRAQPTTGWNVKRDTSSNTPPTARGTYSGPHFVRDDENAVIYKATTEHKDFGQSGIIDFCIVFTETRDVVKETDVSEEIKLNWGNSKVFFPKADWRPGWKIIFKTFDNFTHEFAGEDTTTTEYLRIEKQGPGFVIKATSSQKLGL